MRKWLILGALCCLAAAPSRTYTYVNGATIDPSQVTTNEDNIYQYLQAGVDTYSAASITSTALSSTAVSSANITDNSITTSDLAATLTFSDGDLVDLSSINASSTSEGLKLPQATSCASSTAEGQLCWDTDNDVLYSGDASAANPVGGISKVLSFSRTAAAGSGAQSVTGMGFKPTTLSVLCDVDASTSASISLGDVNAAEVQLYYESPNWNVGASNFISITSGANSMLAVLTSMDSDGFTVTWTKANAGANVNCEALGWR